MSSRKFNCPACGNNMNVKITFVTDGILRHPEDVEMEFFIVEAECKKCNHTIKSHNKTIPSCYKDVDK